MRDKENQRKISNPLKWHGGKTYLANTIISLFPNHTHYVEPFFGGGAVLFAKPACWINGRSELINDINNSLMTFWSVLREECEYNQLVRYLEATPFAQAEWERAMTDFPKDRVEEAAFFFIRYRQSRQGMGSVFATMSRSRTRRGMNEQVSSWLSAIEGLPEFHERLKRVVVTNEDALEIIRKEDSEHTFFYLDPPYLQSTRVVPNAYEHELDEFSHESLLELLSGLEGKFLLSGYSNKLYQGFAKKFQWRMESVDIDNKASSQKIKPIKTECMWMNY